MATRTTQQPEEPQPADEQDAVTRPEDLGFVRPREIEVDRIKEVAQPPGADGLVVIQMAETIEEFTYGNPHVSYTLERGKRYRVPVDIARYLYGIGKLYMA